MNILKPRRRLNLASALLLGAGAIFALFIYGASALAEGASSGSIAQSIVQAISEGILWIASIFNSITIFIVNFVVEIASYNNYINSGAVTLGWVLVRDVTNMLFVIILMVIAFGTVLGLEQYEWKKMLVKFVLAAILVNFSRIICGIIIDAAQVFMMTFISGVAAIAGGNLMQALGMQQINSFSAQTNPEAMTYANIFASSIMIMIFSFAAMVIIGAYLVVLMGRVVALWILIILSPLAFVLGVIPKFQSYASEWWQQFTNNVISGPVLAFFLWLSFAVAGSGGVHNAEFGGSNVAYPLSNTQAEMDQATRDSGEGSTLLLEILQMENLASFIIAAALLMAGVKVTQRLAGVGAGVLGAAAGAATKFATVAGGVAAARWAVGAAATGAKKVGKGVLMKAPLVGGEAWMRRGRGLKAQVGMRYQDLAQKYEAKTAAGLKKAEGQKGVGAALKRGFFRTALTPAQKEKRTAFLEGAAKAAKDERMEKLGMGGTDIGKLAGSRLMRAEIAKQEAERDKKRGLGFAKAQEYRRVGKHDLADMVDAGVSAEIFEEDTKKYANLDFAGKVNLAREMASTTQKIRDNLMSAVQSGDEKMIEASKSALKEQTIKNMNFQAMASSDRETREAVDGVFLKNSGYSGDIGTENSAAMEMSKMTGLDAANIDHQSILKDLQNNLEKDSNFQTSAKNLAKAEFGLYSQTGDMRYASAFSQGVSKDSATGRMKVVYGMGANVGTHDLEGNERTEARDMFTTDKGKIEYLSTTARPNFQQNVNAEIIMKQKDRATGEVRQLDGKQMEAMSGYLSTVSPQMMRRAFSPKFVTDINKLASEGKMSSEQASEFLNTITSKMTNDQQKAELRRVLKDLDKLAGGSTTGGGAVGRGGGTEEDEIEAADADEGFPGGRRT